MCIYRLDGSSGPPQASLSCNLRIYGLSSNPPGTHTKTMVKAQQVNSTNNLGTNLTCGILHTLLLFHEGVEHKALYMETHLSPEQGCT